MQIYYLAFISHKLTKIVKLHNQTNVYLLTLHDSHYLIEAALH